MKEFDDTTGKAAIATGKPVVIDFWGPGCGPCMKLAPVMEELAAKYEGRVEVGKASVEDAADMAFDFGIRSIPTVIFFNNGEEQARKVGFVKLSVLEETLEKIL